MAEDMKLRADIILEQMAKTFRERNATYKDNWVTVGKVMEALFPEGLTLRTDDDFARFHFFDWVVGKLTRFVASDMKHMDSVHDAAVYLAMLETHLLLKGDGK